MNLASKNVGSGRSVLARLLAAGGIIPLLAWPFLAPGQDAARAIALVEMAHATLEEEVPRTWLSNAISALAYSPDGGTLAVGMRNPDRILLLDPATLAVRGRLDGHLAMVARLQFLPDGKTLVSSGHDGTVRVWDVATREERLLLDRFQGNVRGLAVGPDGRAIYAGDFVPGNPGSILALAARDGEPLGKLVGHARGVEDLAVAPDGLTLASTSRDQTVRLWDLTTFRPKQSFATRGTFASGVAFLPDGKSLAAVYNDGTLRLFDVATMQPRYAVQAVTPADFLILAVAPDGATLATTDKARIQLWHAADGASLGAVAQAGDRAASVRFAPNGRSLAVAGLNGAVRVYRFDRQEP